MTDADIHAFGPQREASPPIAKPSARRGPRLLRWLLVGGLASAFIIVAVSVGVAFLLSELASEGFNVVVNGERWAGFDVHGGDVVGGVVGAGLAVAAVSIVVLLTVGIVVPLAILCGIVAAGLGIGAAVLVVAVVAAVLLSPLWLVVLVLWLALRRRPATAPAQARG